MPDQCCAARPHDLADHFSCADVAPVDLVGTAFGLFNPVTGVALLIASSQAGVLWQAFGSTATFAAGAVLAAVAAVVLTAAGKLRTGADS